MNTALTQGETTMVFGILLSILVLLVISSLMLFFDRRRRAGPGQGSPPWINRHGNLLRCIRRAVWSRNGRNRV